MGLLGYATAPLSGARIDTETSEVGSYTPFKKQLQGRWSKLRHSDMRAIRQRVEGISHITPVLFTQSGTQDKLSYRSQVTFRAWWVSVRATPK